VQQGECLSEDCGCDEEIDSSEEMVSSMGSLMPDIEGPHHGRVAVGDARETWMRTCRESSLCLGLACDRRMRTAPIVACVSRGSYHPLYPTTVQAEVIDRRHLYRHSLWLFAFSFFLVLLISSATFPQY